MMNRTAVLLLSFFLLLPAHHALAQEKSGTLLGIVSDESGAVFPSVKVTANNKENQRTFTARTVADGSYFIHDLEPGEYTVRFELAGFSSVEIKRLNILAGRTVKFDVQLQTGSAD